MKKVISVLVLMLGASLSAFATSSCYSNLLVNVSDSCMASVDGTNFTVSLISLSNTTLNPAVNINVNPYSATSGTDTFAVQVYGANGTHFTGNVGANFDVAVSGNAGASVSSIQTTISGRGTGAVLTTSTTPGGGPWTLTSALFSNANSGPTSVSPHFVSSEIDTGLTIPSGLSLSGYTETFTVIWTAYVPPPPPPPVTPSPLVADPPGAPEPGTFGLAALAGLVGVLAVRRRRLQA
ncbi:MAG: PEP-CTERM sorting domain-containing protein [Bryobacteraceae bacterium]